MGTVPAVGSNILVIMGADLGWFNLDLVMQQLSPNRSQKEKQQCDAFSESQR